MANSKVPKMLVGVIAQHRENNLDFQWLNALRPQVLFNYLVRQHVDREPTSAAEAC